MTGQLLDTRPLRLAPTAFANGRAKRLVVALVTTAVAVVALWHIVVISDGAIGTGAGLGLLTLTPSLGRGRRRALLVSIALSSAIAALDLALGEQRAAFAAIAIGLLLAAATPAFPSRGDPATRRRLLVGAAVGIGAVVADLAHARGAIDHPLLVAAGVTAVLLVALSAGPWHDRRGRDPESRAAAAQILAEHGSDTLAPFALRPDKRIFLSPDARAFLSYTTVAGVALVSGSPIGPDGCHGALLDAFVADAGRRGLVVAALGVPGDALDAWRQRGFRAHYTGDEAIVDPAAFELAGRAIRKVRQSVARVEREGYRMQMVRGCDLTVGRAGRITRIAESWKGGRRETGFSMAFESATPDAGRDDLYALAIAADGEPHGFLHLADVAAGRALSLSAMRRLPDTPNGLNEFLVVETLAWAREHGYRSVSLNFAAFAAVLDPPGQLDRVAALEARALRRLSSRFQLDRLRAFSGKFGPAWLPRYAVYPSTAALPRVALAAMLAEAYVALPLVEGGSLVTLALALCLALASVVALDVGFLLQQHAVSSAPSLALRRPFEAARALAGARVWVAGFVIGLAGWGLYLVAVSRAPLSLVQAVSGGGIGLLVLLAAVLGRSRPSRRDVTGALLLATGGLLLLATTLSSADGTTARSLRTGELVLVSVAALVVAALAVRRGGAAAGGLAAGCLYGAGDITSKALFVALPAHPRGARRARHALAVRHPRRPRRRLHPPPTRFSAGRPGRIGGTDDRGHEPAPDRRRHRRVRRPATADSLPRGRAGSCIRSGCRRRDPSRAVPPEDLRGGTGAGDGMTRVLVADDHPAYRRGVVRALERAGHEVVAQADDGAAALELARRLAPDVALLDLRMPEASGSEVASVLRDEGSPTRVVVLSAYIEPEVVSAALSAGVYGYLSKDASRAAIVWAVSAAGHGEPVSSLPSS